MRGALRDETKTAARETNFRTQQQKIRRELKYRSKFPTNGTGIFIIIIIFFRIENMNGIELYHLQNTGKFFRFSREKEAQWYW